MKEMKMKTPLGHLRRQMLPTKRKIMMTVRKLTNLGDDSNSNFYCNISKREGGEGPLPCVFQHLDILFSKRNRIFSYFLFISIPTDVCIRVTFIYLSCFHFSRLEWTGKNPREEPKGIVFLSKLLLLFQQCHLCFSANPALSVTQTGTMMTIQSSCSRCSGTFIWQSQPYLLVKFPAGNLLLSFAILCAGASVNKVLLVFRYMGMLIYSQPTYYYHQ